MPIVVMLAGPNGAGKTTASAMLLRGPLQVSAFVNADIIAQGLAGRDTEQAAIQAGRIMLQRLDELGEERADFAFETTLASRTFANRITKWKDQDYIFCLLYLWLPKPEFSINRVRDRVRRGGHHVPDDTIRRRYRAGLRNFFELYRPMADVWRFYDNTYPAGPRLIAAGVRGVETIKDDATWRQVLQGVQDDPKEPGR
jgi:predicted ABC-type ATPase